MFTALSVPPALDVAKALLARRDEVLGALTRSHAGFVIDAQGDRFDLAFAAALPEPAGEGR